MKSKVFFLIAVLLGVMLFFGISMFSTPPIDATTVTTHVQNADPNPWLKGSTDVWYGILDSTSLSINVGDSWKGNVWNIFDIYFETASDTWQIFDGGAYTYTNLHYDAYSRADTLQATLTGAGSGGKYVVVGYDYDGI